MNKKTRCFGGKPGQELYAEYHDTEWGVPAHDDRHLFEMLVLEGAQAGLSWETILKRREGYRRAFHGFDPTKVASMTDHELGALLQNPEIIRNRLKIYSARQNAQVFLKIQQEFDSFDRYVWGFVGGVPAQNHWSQLKEAPATTRESDALSKDLKKRGMTFVGSTIMYAYMQAVGMVNDHPTSCPCYAGPNAFNQSQLQNSPPLKNDDFEAGCEGRLKRPEAAPTRPYPAKVGEETRPQHASKGRFCGGGEFCNWLSIFAIQERVISCYTDPYVQVFQAPRKGVAKESCLSQWQNSSPLWNRLGCDHPKIPRARSL